MRWWIPGATMAQWVADLYIVSLQCKFDTFYYTGTRWNISRILRGVSFLSATAFVATAFHISRSTNKLGCSLSTNRPSVHICSRGRASCDTDRWQIAELGTFLQIEGPKTRTPRWSPSKNYVLCIFCLHSLCIIPSTGKVVVFSKRLKIE